MTRTSDPAGTGWTIFLVVAGTEEFVKLARRTVALPVQQQLPARKRRGSERVLPAEISFLLSSADDVEFGQVTSTATALLEDQSSRLLLLRSPETELTVSVIGISGRSTVVESLSRELMTITQRISGNLRWQVGLKSSDEFTRDYQYACSAVAADRRVIATVSVMQRGLGDAADHLTSALSEIRGLAGEDVSFEVFLCSPSGQVGFDWSVPTVASLCSSDVVITATSGNVPKLD